MKILGAHIQESPLYEITTEDGLGTAWSYCIIAWTMDETDEGRYTHHKTFESWEKEQAEAFADRITKTGEIDLAHWELGTPWDRYNTPQTYAEEKTEALFNEYQ